MRIKKSTPAVGDLAAQRHFHNRTILLIYIISVTVSGTTEHIAWTTLPNWTYELQYRNDFSSPWQSLGNYSSTGTTNTATDMLTPTARYYRVQVLAGPQFPTKPRDNATASTPPCGE